MVGQYIKAVVGKWQVSNIAVDQWKLVTGQPQVATSVPQHLFRKIESHQPRIRTPLEDTDTRYPRPNPQVEHRQLATGQRWREVLSKAAAVLPPHLVPGHPRIKAGPELKRQLTDAVAESLIEAQAATFALCRSMSRAMPGTASSTCFFAVGRSFS